MRTWLLVGSLAAGVLLFVYEWYNNREREQYESSYDNSGPRFSDEDYIEINETTPKEVEQRLGNKAKLPGPDDTCSICLDPFMLKDAERKYCIIALPQCGHWFHQRCAMRLLEYHPHCPICRVPIDHSSLRGRPVTVLGSRREAASSQNGDNNNSTRAGSSSSLSPLRQKKD